MMRAMADPRIVRKLNSWYCLKFLRLGSKKEVCDLCQYFLVVFMKTIILYLYLFDKKLYPTPYLIQPIRELETHCIFCGIQEVAFH